VEAFQIGDIVARKSHGHDTYFKIINVIEKRGAKPVYVLRGVLYRIEADSYGDDLVRQDARQVRLHTSRFIADARKKAYGGRIQRGGPYRGFFPVIRYRNRPGRVLHIDSSGEFIEMCVKHYRDAGVLVYTQQAAESEQPNLVGSLLRRYSPDILVLTGHDGIGKNCSKYSLDCYRNSKYFVQSVTEARRYESDPDSLAIFAGACQSYYEAIMRAGANFASSPGRVFINALDPAIVSERISLTDTRSYVSPEEIADVTVSGSDGISGVRTRGQMRRV